jgi:hypothetical protein
MATDRNTSKTNDRNTRTLRTRGPDTKTWEELSRGRREALDKWTEKRRDRRQGKSRRPRD